MKLITAYALSVLLIASYFAILFISVSPSVPSTYRMFYIDHNLKFMPPTDSITFELGKNLFLDGTKDKAEIFWGTGSGWNCPGVWNKTDNDGRSHTEGLDNKLFFENLSDKDLVITFFVSSTDSSVMNLTTTSGYAYSFTLNSTGEFSAVVPKEYISDGQLCMNIAPDSEDSKIYVDYIRID